MGDGPYRVWKNRMKGTRLIQKQENGPGFILSLKVIMPTFMKAISLQKATTVLLWLLKQKTFSCACLRRHGKRINGIIMNPYFRQAIYRL